MEFGDRVCSHVRCDRGEPLCERDTSLAFKLAAVSRLPCLPVCPLTLHALWGMKGLSWISPCFAEYGTKDDRKDGIQGANPNFKFKLIVFQF